MADKLGVFICGCGPNLEGKLSTADLAVFARALPGVAGVWTHGLLCSAAGQSFLAQEIQASAVEKIVVAGCSPREHELTFRSVLEKAGLNPFQLQMANLREQCVWVTTDPEQAAQKARELLRAAVGRVREHQPIPKKEKEVNPDVLVIGAGVAGITAALNCSGPGRRVHLVERAPFLGGKTVLYEKVFPGLECGACLLSPWIDRVLHEESIQVYLTSEIEQVKGSFGNFQVGLRQRARGVDAEKCLGCGACQGVCPVRAPNEHFLGLADRPAIYLPFPGALPAVAILDRDRCLYHQGEGCRACQEACPLGAVALDQEDQIREIEVGAIVLATGFETVPGKTSGAGIRTGRSGFISGLEAEILFNSSGPTGGRLPWPEGVEPGAVGIIACQDWEEGHPESYQLNPLLGPYLKLARQIKEQRPEAAIRFYYRELNLPSPEAVRFFQELSREAGIYFKRLDPGQALRISRSGGRYRMEYRERSGNRRNEAFDLLIVAEEGAGSADAPGLAKKLRLPLDEAGFWKTRAEQLEPVNTRVEGIYAVGCARGPRDIPGAILDGQAAAGQILRRLVPGQRIALEPMTVQVLEEYCSGCRICLETCPFLALEWAPEPESIRVNEVLCRGCGLCAAACPSGALQARHYGDRQLTAEIRGLLHAENG
ncbi:MAG: CoB--CoM heterodisulfide reductase iron-sulfur subunit A family protein [Deltaproteobacteria bacterium]|nr:CoB--CoM heterodisulfide reductase iron-sulfur subunit A family protein [Deltaproteobacteria bacterium]